MPTFWKDATAPQPPYYAVIFISQKSDDLAGYTAMDQRMMELAQQQPGFLGYSSVSEKAKGIFISYWKDEESIKKWRDNAEHGYAKAEARRWYATYHSLITRVQHSSQHPVDDEES
ncbi:MAG: antibiotic biosynthesis monooxygenase family protein [Owenweeksia sp.]|nr:antibiotic biosynthesis monooxygenase family protein [Owenweeksia sp.]